MAPLDMSRQQAEEHVLDIGDLSVEIAGIHPVRNVSLSLGEGETLTLIGESGSGKSMLGLAVAGLLPDGAQTKGTMTIDGAAYDCAATRGRGIAFIPQASGAALNPCVRAGSQVEETFRHTLGLARNEAREATDTLLSQLGLTRDETRRYPHQLSGGMRQRVMLAIGLACRPRILIADEPTKGVDARLLDDVIDVFRQVRRENPQMIMIIVTHDLRFAAAVADRVAVMYGGRIMEDAPAAAFFDGPRHPYAKGLLNATPEAGLIPIPGEAPYPGHPLPGCPFAPRCACANGICHVDAVPMIAANASLIACHHHDHP